MKRLLITVFLVLLSSEVYADKVIVFQDEQEIDYFYTEDFKSLNPDNTGSSFQIRLFIDVSYERGVKLSKNVLKYSDSYAKTHSVRKAIGKVLMNKQLFKGHIYRLICYDDKGKILATKDVDISLTEDSNDKIMLYYAERTNYYDDQLFQSAMIFYNTIKALRNASPERKRELYQQWKALYPQYVHRVPPIQ
jgi:hypothetical protein